MSAVEKITTWQRELAVGIHDLNNGRYQTYDDDSLLLLAQNIGCLGRERLKCARAATNEADPIPHRGTYNQDSATGFIRLNALRLKVAAKVQRTK